MFFEFPIPRKNISEICEIVVGKQACDSQIKKSLGLQSLSSTTASCPEAPPLPAKQPAAAVAPQQPQAPAGATTCGQCKQALPPAAAASQLQQQVTDPDSERSHCAYAGSCSEDCYSYSGSVCSCAGSCDQQPAAGPEFGCEEFNHRSCCTEVWDQSFTLV